MKNILKYIDIKTILILLLIVALLLSRCSHDKKPGETVYIKGRPYQVLKHDIDTQYIPKEKIVFKTGKDIYHEKPIYIKIPLSIDTIQIINDYFAKNVYKDTLQLGDSLGMITVFDTIQKNNILNRTWHSTVNLMKIKELLIVKETRNQVYVGFDTRLNSTDIFNSVGADIGLKTKRDMFYNVAVGVSNSSTTLKPYLGFGMQWKIKLK